MDFGPVRPFGAIPPTPDGVGPSRSRSHGRLRRPQSTAHPAVLAPATAAPLPALTGNLATVLPGLRLPLPSLAGGWAAPASSRGGRTRALSASSRRSPQAASIVVASRRCVFRARQRASPPASCRCFVVCPYRSAAFKYKRFWHRCLSLFPPGVCPASQNVGRRRRYRPKTCPASHSVGRRAHPEVFFAAKSVEIL